jgi:hypothetical protein
MLKVISIFALPHEIDMLENTLTQLKRSFRHLKTPQDWTIHVTTTLEDDMVDWENSKIPKSYFEEKFEKLGNDWDSCNKSFNISTKIKGCVSQRRETLLQYPKSDYYIWLDTDIIFDEQLLYYMENSISAVHETYPYTIITPEIVKVWDNTWDCLVNERFLSKPIDYQKTNDPYIDSLIVETPSLEQVHNKYVGQPRFKFAGGWFTCLSGELLRRIGVPESFQHYGLEDTLIMHGSEKLISQQNLKIYQFKIKNLVICENYKYRDTSYITNNLKSINRKDEFLQISRLNFQSELNTIK